MTFSILGLIRAVNMKEVHAQLIFKKLLIRWIMLCMCSYVRHFMVMVIIFDNKVNNFFTLTFFRQRSLARQGLRHITSLEPGTGVHS